jgi:hypothetical protein
MMEVAVGLLLVLLAVGALVVLLVAVLRMRTTPVRGTPTGEHGGLSDDELDELLAGADRDEKGEE